MLGFGLCSDHNDEMMRCICLGALMNEPSWNIECTNHVGFLSPEHVYRRRMHITEYQAGASAFLYRALSHADEEHFGNSVDRDASDVFMHKDSEEGSASYRRGRTVVRRRSGERVSGHVLQAKPHHTRSAVPHPAPLPCQTCFTMCGRRY